MSNTIKVIGIGDDGREGLSPLCQKWIEESERLAGGERQLAFFPDYQGEKFVIKDGIRQLFAELEREEKKTVVLASGDPLFYGIGPALAKRFPVEIYPSFSSVQLAFARIGESWHDAYITSVHGRPLKGLAQKIDGRSKIALLTDKENTPGKIAAYLLSFGMTEYRMFVGENLGGQNERTGWYKLEEASRLEFSTLNIVVLKKTCPSPEWPTGIPDHEFAQRKPEKGLITKREIRVLVLAALGLKKDSVVWDIGTCTGSVAIEAARIAKEGKVYAIEKNADDLENCRKNMVKFRTDFFLMHGQAPEGLESFEDPDAVFVGGSSHELEAILDVCASRLKKGGRIVVNAVTIEKLSDAVRFLKERGFGVNITLAQISQSKPILQLTRFAAYNPVYIITGQREGEEK